MNATPTREADQIPFSALLESAITEPGKIHEGYSAFHDYSIGNQLLVIFQCHARGIPLGPIATFNRWKERGRHVQKGQKAITLCQPVTVKREIERWNADPGEVAFTRFVYRRNWFVLAQTDGQPFIPDPIPSWDRARALQTLGIEEIAFDHLNGNAWGFARGRQVAISPLSPLPDRTLLHEVAHVVLGHTTEHEEQDGPTTPRNIREVEAEGVAFLCSAALGLPGCEYSRGYLQHWLRGADIPERSAQQIFKAADVILRAGREEASDDRL